MHIINNRPRQTWQAKMTVLWFHWITHFIDP